MRKLTVFFLVVAQFSLMLGVIPVHAEGSNSQPLQIEDNQLNNVFTFDQLGFKGKALVGPYDSLNLFFSLPANVALAPGGSLFLKFNVTGATNLSAQQNENWLGGTLLVYFNEELIDTIVLDKLGEEITKEIPIPSDALTTYVPDGRHHLQLFLSADLHCDITDTLLLVDKNSSLTLQFQTITPVKDLSLLPRPIYQPDSILPSKSYIVVPDNPEDYELQAAMSVAAGLGSMTEGKLDLSLVTSSTLPEEARNSEHLIFVGLAKKFPSLKDTKFPIAITDQGLILSQQNDNDGIVQIAESPWSKANVALFIGGNSPEAVVKAGQAFSAGKLVAVEKPDVSIISNTNPTGGSLAFSEDYTLKDLGYDTVTMGLFGDNYLTFNFYVSPEQAASTGAYLDLVVAHSELLNLDATGITVLLNDEVIGGVRLQEESPSTIHINLIPDILRRGVNRLEIITDMVPYYTCYSTDLLSNWVTISNTSTIHLPITEKQIKAGETMNLGDFPYMLLNDRNMSDLAFVVAKNDPVSWDYASKAAFYIGSKGNVPLVNALVAYADNIPDSILKNYNLFIFGRATKLPIISQLSGSLPAPFAYGSDEAVQPDMLVNYSVLPVTHVGYLELAASPYNPDKTILAVLGNSDAGVPMAGVALTKDELISKLAGDFAILYSDQIVSTDTRLGESGAGIVPTPSTENSVQTPVPAAPDDTATEPQIESRPAWILPVFIGISLFILILLVFMLRREAKSRVVFEEGSTHEEGADRTKKTE